MAKLFTSDLHFGHRNLVGWTDRKLATTPDEHDDWLVSIWNRDVKPTDTVYHLGDLALFKAGDRVRALLERLNGYKYFIIGNHDEHGNHCCVLKKYVGQYSIELVKHYTSTTVGDNDVMLFHFPMGSWHKQRYGSWHLHGHSHGEYTQSRGKMLDVGLDNAYKMYGEHRFFTEEDIATHMATIEEYKSSITYKVKTGGPMLALFNKELT